MSLNFKSRERIGYFGGVKILTGSRKYKSRSLANGALRILLLFLSSFSCIFRVFHFKDLIRNDFRKDSALLHLAICALRNLMFNSPTNRGQCADEDGLFALTDVYISTTWDKIQQQCLGALKILIGNSW